MEMVRALAMVGGEPGAAGVRWRVHGGGERVVFRKAKGTLLGHLVDTMQEEERIAL